MLNDESERDTELCKKRIAADFKNLVKNSSLDHKNSLMSQINQGFSEYYEELNKKVSEELYNQETQQKSLHDKNENYLSKIEKLSIKMKRNLTIKAGVISHFSEKRKKLSAFNFLKNFLLEQTIKTKKKRLVSRIVESRLKRKALSTIKKFSLLEKTQAYEHKIKERTENDLIKLEEDLKLQKDQLILLIQRAEDKLQHENRKKIQTKLQLDQIVLRGVTALNLKALSLSQNSLNDVVKADYVKEYEKKYKSLLFPNTKTTMSNKVNK